MVALATHFGSFIKTAVENTTQGLYDTSAGAINSTDLMHIAGQSFDENSSQGTTYSRENFAALEASLNLEEAPDCFY